MSSDNNLELTNAEYIRHSIELESLLPKPTVNPCRPEWPVAALKFNQCAYRKLRGQDIPAHATVLDYGCGWGATVSTFCDAGYDAYGVEVLEYWGEDAVQFGGLPLSMPPEIIPRLSLLTENKTRTCFADNFFDLIVSNQTVEHVFDHRSTFREQARILKPGGVAIHMFPHINTLREAHTKVPLTRLNRYRWWLALWALAGYRSHRQKGLNWRQTLRSNQVAFATTHYVPKPRLLAYAREAGLAAHFMDPLACLDSRVARLSRRTQQRWFSPLVEPLLRAVSMNVVLVLESPDNPGQGAASLK
jgi:2-polyprenyl-3-methyl-5-hydroxy-6-metoxy-1,4-benzoquinol methylase